MPPPDLYVFAGPTLAGAVLPPFPGYATAWRPPAARHDIARLAAGSPPGVIALVDGVFHQSLAVGHVELREALAAGWEVWGLSSIGAIRAYEMRDLGMRGFGRVYARFLGPGDFRDDEVALLHEPDPPFRPLSEPLVHLREALDDFTATGLIEEGAVADILADLEGRWFGERKLGLFRQLLASRAAASAMPAIDGRLAAFEPYRAKTRDLEAFLGERPWKRDRA